jgi:hypothetical protein
MQSLVMNSMQSSLDFQTHTSCSGSWVESWCILTSNCSDESSSSESDVRSQTTGKDKDVVRQIRHATQSDAEAGHDAAVGVMHACLG